MRLFDTHIHMTDPRFDPDREELLRGLAGNSVGLILTPAADMNESRASAALSEKYPFVYAAVGVHPHEADSFTPDDAEELKSLAALPKTVAVGEIGLDYHYDLSDRAAQRRVFARQLELAEETGLPVIIHSRDACADTLEIIRASAVRRGVIHCFGGSRETAAEYLDMGFYISFTGIITFPNAKRYGELVAAVPLERLMIETDAPYMTPVPHRGERNEAKFVALVAERIAEIRGLSVEQVAEATFVNGCRLFGIPL